MEGREECGKEGICGVALGRVGDVKGGHTVIAHVDDGVAPVLGIRLGEDYFRELLCAHALQISDSRHLSFRKSRKVLMFRRGVRCGETAGTFLRDTLFPCSHLR